jgi:hypothetical protein
MISSLADAAIALSVVELDNLVSPPSSSERRTAARASGSGPNAESLQGSSLEQPAGRAERACYNRHQEELVTVTDVVAIAILGFVLLALGAIIAPELRRRPSLKP